MENLRPSWVSEKLDCPHVGLLETLCCMGRLPHDESVLTDSFGCTGLWKKSSSGESAARGFLTGAANLMWLECQCKASFVCLCICAERTRESEREQRATTVCTRLTDPATSLYTRAPAGHTTHTHYTVSGLQQHSYPRRVEALRNLSKQSFVLCHH